MSDAAGGSALAEGAGGWWLGRGVDPDRSLLDHLVSYAELVDAGALGIISERQLRRWFDGRPTLTVGEILAVRTHIAWKFWAIMRDEVLPDTMLHQLAVDYTTEFMRRFGPAYVDFRTYRGLDAKQAWLDNRISIGELQVVTISANEALTTVAYFGDQTVSDCASMACQALAGLGEDAQRQAFYAFIGRFHSGTDVQWLLDHVRSRLSQAPAGWAVSTAAAPAGPAPAIDTCLPVGTVLPYAGWLPKDLVPRGWLVCDGSTRLARDYDELFRAIGYTFGAKSKTVPEFNLPDLRGRFIRSTAPSLAKRNQRDPEWQERFALMPGGESQASVGSYQGYGTARPRTPFSTEISDLNLVSANDAAGCGTNPGAHGSSSSSLKLSGGDAETRPPNKYVYFIIKASSTDGTGQPGQVPVGAVIPFAGPAGLNPPPPGQWQECAGQSVSRIGQFARLFDAIGTAHGGGGNDFLLPDYRGWFLRGVSESSNADPDRDRRPPAADGGFANNNVGSRQDWATAIPYHTSGGDQSLRLLRAQFDNLPTRNQGKLVDVTGRRLALVNPSGKNLTLNLGTSGDAETRPENVSVAYCIKSEPTGEVPVGTIAMLARDLPASEFWLPCDGRTVAVAEYSTLHQAIGTIYGSPGAGQLSLPDLEGRFVRGASLKTGRDADAASRIPLGSGDPEGAGSVQDYATGKPRADLTVSVPHLPSNTCSTGGGARGGAAGNNGAKRIDPWGSGGNADTRPVNLYLNFYIRVR
jgi:microcystin-dependent protein